MKTRITYEVRTPQGILVELMQIKLGRFADDDPRIDIWIRFADWCQRQWPSLHFYIGRDLSRNVWFCEARVLGGLAA